MFGENPTQAGQYFYDWLDSRGTLVAGGKLLDELDDYIAFTKWFRGALTTGRARQIPDDDVDAETERLRALDVCLSDDEHVLGLAIVSGARLLYTNDRDLQRDFGNPRIVNNPRGRVYTTAQSRSVTDSHRTMLSRPRPSRRCLHCGN